MQIQNPITITPPPIIKDGETHTFSPITLAELDVTIVDNSKKKVCSAQIKPCPRMLTLWENESYDAAGDYTQAQAEARVVELLGGDPASALEELFGRR
jgi:hypothetical protein